MGREGRRGGHAFVEPTDGKDKRGGKRGFGGKTEGGGREELGRGEGRTKDPPPKLKWNSRRTELRECKGEGARFGLGPPRIARCNRLYKTKEEANV